MGTYCKEMWICVFRYSRRAHLVAAFVCVSAPVSEVLGFRRVRKVGKGCLDRLRSPTALILSNNCVVEGLGSLRKAL